MNKTVYIYPEVGELYENSSIDFSEADLPVLDKFMYATQYISDFEEEDPSFYAGWHLEDVIEQFSVGLFAKHPNLKSADITHLTYARYYNEIEEFY